MFFSGTIYITRLPDVVVSGLTLYHDSIFFYLLPFCQLPSKLTEWNSTKLATRLEVTTI